MSDLHARFRTLDDLRRRTSGPKPRPGRRPQDRGSAHRPMAADCSDPLLGSAGPGWCCPGRFWTRQAPGLARLPRWLTGSFLVAQGPIRLGDIVFNRDLALYTIDADGDRERQIHESWDGIGLSKDGTTFFSPAPAPDGRLLTLSLRPMDPANTGCPWTTQPCSSASATGPRTAHDWFSTPGTTRMPRAGSPYRVPGRRRPVRLTDPGLRYDSPPTPVPTPRWRPGPLLQPCGGQWTTDTIPMNLFVVNADGSGLLQLNPPDVRPA